MRFLLFSMLTFCFIKTSSAQTIIAKLFDENSKEPIPFATIQFSKTGAVMSNEEGTFNFEIKKNQILNDSVVISSLGYKTKRVFLKDSLPQIIYLKEEVYKIAPVVLSNNKMTPVEIIDKVKNNLSKNYATTYFKSKAFSRNTYKQHVNKFTIKLKKSTIDNIDQNLFDTIVAKLPKRMTSLVETFGVSYLDKNLLGKLQLEKMMLIKSKQEKTSINSIQEDFLKALKDNMKPNSYLIIKTGILRIDKTESIDSITKPKIAKTKEQGKKTREATQKWRNDELNRLLKDIVVSPDSRINFLDKSSRYVFTKVGYVELGEELVYVLEFQPKGNAEYKGKLYINTQDFAIIKSEIQSAKPVFDKHFNLFGIKNNDLTYKNTNIFQKDKDGKYHIKYVKSEMTSEMAINRPFKIIEKNKFVKGRNTQNKVSLHFDYGMINQSIKELVFNRKEALTKMEYDAVKLNSDYEIGRFNSYNKDFWKGYNIITPENAIQELKID